MLSIRRILPLLALFAVTAVWLASSPDGDAGGPIVPVPEEVRNTLRSEGSVDVIVAVRSDDVLARLRELRNRGDLVGLGREAEEGFAPRLDDVLNGLADRIVVERFEHIGGAHLTIRDEATLDGLARHPLVRSINLSRALTAQLDASLPLINQPEAAAAGYRGNGTSVAILDTGVEYGHADFGSCTAPGVPASCRVPVARDFAEEDSQRDDNGHGSNVAGIAAGVAPGADILALDVFRNVLGENLAYDSDISAAIDWVIANAATYNPKSVNLSLGGDTHTSTCSGGLDSAFAALRAAGILPVVAAGNNAKTNGVAYPGCLAGAFTVGAVYDAPAGLISFSNCSDALPAADQVTCFSNSHATMLDSLAPGAQITAGGQSNYSGTSMAAPHVAGAAAVLGAIPGASLDDVEDTLINTGPRITDERNGVVKRRLDLQAATNDLRGASSAPVLVRRDTQDLDRDGHIDAIKLIFDRDVNDDFAGLVLDVEGYVVSSITAARPGDRTIYVHLNEKTKGDTGIRPDVRIVANGTLGAGGSLVPVEVSATQSRDRAAPAIIDASTRSERRVKVRFSEGVNASTVLAGDFDLNVAGPRTVTKAAKVSNKTFTLVTSSDWGKGEDGNIALIENGVVKDLRGLKSKQVNAVAVRPVY